MIIADGYQDSQGDVSIPLQFNNYSNIMTL